MYKLDNAYLAYLKIAKTVLKIIKFVLAVKKDLDLT